MLLLLYVRIQYSEILSVLNLDFNGGYTFSVGDLVFSGAFTSDCSFLMICVIRELCLYFFVL
jgi:hypothetical protein